MHAEWVEAYLSDPLKKRCYQIHNIEYFNVSQMQVKQQFFYQQSKKYCVISYRQPTTVKCEKKRDQQTDSRYQIQSIKAELIYVDETSIGRKIARPKFWQLKAKVTQQMTCDNKNLAQFLELQLKELLMLLYMHTIYKDSVKIFKGNAQKNIVLVLDNAKKVRDFVLTIISHIFLPPNTPELNLINIFWGLLKESLLNQNILMILISINASTMY